MTYWCCYRNPCGVRSKSVVGEDFHTDRATEHAF